MSAAVVVLAAGSGSRVGAAVNKVLLPLADTTVLGMSLRAALRARDVHRIVVVHREGEAEAVADAIRPVLGDGEVSLVVGGATRHGSEWRALRVLRGEIEAGEIDVVAIHDGARPLASPELFDLTVALARQVGGAIPAAPMTGLVDRSTLRQHSGLVGVQTPQAFRAGELLAAYVKAEAEGFDGTDTAATLAHAGETTIAAVPSSPLNLKVTFPEDIATVAALIAR
jgi:2-C-methyl-D-erythritol 4-phosphate cytidylyltransferase